MSNVLVPRLNEVIKEQCVRLGLQWHASDHAPGTYQDLRADGSKRVLTVWAGASDNTIYGDPAVNHAFRAWHDAIHVRHELAFTLEGEIAAARIQASMIGGTLAEFIIAEVQGNAEYFAQFGMFPANPVQFVKGWLTAKGV